jgi:hypothetical protein
MPVDCPELGVVVTAAPGTGSTSLLAWALALPGARPLLDADVRRPDGSVAVDAKHATVDQLVAAGRWDPQPRRIITSTRNPFDHWHAEWFRTRTRWARDAADPGSWVHRVEGMSTRIELAGRLGFADWVEAEIGARADAGERWHLNRGHVAEADVVLRMEHLDADLAAAGLHDVGPAIPHENRTDGRGDPRADYTPRARQIVAAVHAPDLDRFGYRYEDLAHQATARVRRSS